MSKSSDEILLFLVKNSKPEYHEYQVSGAPLEGAKPLTKEQKLLDLLLAASGTTRYLCPLKDFQAFLGEDFSFEKHLRPLYEAGTLYFSGIPDKGDFYDSKSYRKVFDTTHGLAGGRPNADSSAVAFHYQENNFLHGYSQLVENATALGLFRKNTKKV